MNDRAVQILLVEEKTAHAELVRRAFESAADHVALTIVSTLDAARDYLVDCTPDLLICDLKLPDGNGIDLLSKEGDACRYSVLIMTSHDQYRISASIPFFRKQVRKGPCVNGTISYSGRGPRLR
jgi:DNA-binding response OmpR family regulator